MNKLLAALFAGALALGFASALAEQADQKPGDFPTRFGDPGYDERRAAARKAAQEKWDKMTPEQQAAAKKAWRAKRLEGQAALDKAAQERRAKITPEEKEPAK